MSGPLTRFKVGRMREDVLVRKGEQLGPMGDGDDRAQRGQALDHVMRQRC